MFTLAQHACLIRPLGSVNTRNVFHFLDPGACRNLDVLQRTGRAGKLTYVATFGGRDQQSCLSSSFSPGHPDVVGQFELRSRVLGLATKGKVECLPTIQMSLQVSEKVFS